MPNSVRIFVVLLLFALDSVWAGGAARTRPSGAGAGGSRSTARGSASGTARTTPTAPSGSAPTRASGQATYGYGGSVGYPCYGSAYPYWGWGAPWGAWGTWGPWGGWGVWGWPAPVYTVAAVPAAGWPAEAARLPAWVETDVRPGKALLRLDGEPVGKAKEYRGTWNKLTVSPGAHVLEFESSGYMTLRVALDARAGGSYRIEENLQEGSGIDPRSAERMTAAAAVADANPRSALRSGRIRLEVLSPDAAVYLDGEFLGSGRELAALHGALPVPAGEHVIDLVQPGYRRKTLQLDVPEGDPVPVRLEFSAEDRE